MSKLAQAELKIELNFASECDIIYINLSDTMIDINTGLKN